MEAVVRTRSREILLATTVGLCMGMAMLTQSLGLSLSLGAFLAGLMLARSQYSMSVISGILPYRDMFMSLFFITVGMMLNLHFFLDNLVNILLSTLFFIVIKSIITMPAVLVQGYPIKVAIIVSMCLAQVGEFAFVLAKQGVAANLFSQRAYQFFLAISVISMMLTPFLISFAPKCANWVQARFKKNAESAGANEPEAESNDVFSKLEDHLIIIGFGISGKHLASVARQSNIPYAILEMNPETVAKNRKEELIMHGDASEPTVLKHLGILKARIMAIVISDPAAVRAITMEAHNLNPNLYIVARTRFVTEIAPLRRMGAQTVISEEFESSIEVFNNVLTHYLVPRQNIDAFAAQIRTKNYRMIRRMTSGPSAQLGSLMQDIPDISLQAVRVEENSPICGLKLKESQLRPKYGVTVVAISRNNTLYAPLDPNIIFEANDIAYLFAKKDKLYAVVQLFNAEKIDTVVQTA